MKLKRWNIHCRNCHMKIDNQDNYGYCDNCIKKWEGKIPVVCKRCKRAYLELPSIIKQQIERGMLLTCPDCSRRLAYRKHL